VGDGALRTALEVLAGELGIAAKVRFLGLRTDVEDLLREANVFMLTSESEGLSLSVIEAMMSGVPAIVPAVGDLAELVEDGVNGFVVKGDRPEEFATPLLSLLENPERLHSFQQAALRSAKRYELEGSVALWDSILDADTEVAGNVG